eukprot:c17467_g1_i2.p1 GENE.c17467_g1_i2~~c17467_g1_i2.p1  ORF type:complete len:261 (+),score=57.69 c17467_g1_i2:850-1632(+)
MVKRLNLELSKENDRLRESITELTAQRNQEHSADSTTNPSEETVATEVMAFGRHLLFDISELHNVLVHRSSSLSTDIASLLSTIPEQTDAAQPTTTSQSRQTFSELGLHRPVRDHSKSRVEQWIKFRDSICPQSLTLGHVSGVLEFVSTELTLALRKFVADQQPTAESVQRILEHLNQGAQILERLKAAVETATILDQSFRNGVCFEKMSGLFVQVQFRSLVKEICTCCSTLGQYGATLHEAFLTAGDGGGDDVENQQRL